MREIKFQAYDPANAKMLDWQTIKEHLIMPGSSGWHWRQFTGLKDKNGKEIYEGDIFKQKGMDDDLITGEVIFDEGYHGFRVKEGDYIFHWLKFAGEVIGNIYENPELLEANHEN